MASTQAERCGVSHAWLAFSSRIFAFADELLDFAQRECAHLPGQRVFELPGKSLRMVFSAPEYAKLCDRAYLVPRCPAGSDERVTLAVLDYTSLPRMPRWNGASPGLGNVTTALAEHGLRGAYDDEHLTWHIYDPERAFGIQVMDEVSLRPPWETSFPLRLLLHWAGRTTDRGMIHAGTLGHDGRGVFLAGAGGAGKSGTTLSGILNGLASVGDDYVAMRVGDAGVEARPVLRLMKQDARGLQRLGLDVRNPLFSEPNWQRKREFDFDALVPGARAERLAMTAILIPRIARSASSSFRPASGREAMMALAPSSLYQLYGNWREDFQLIASVARALPAFHLDLSEDPVEIAAAIQTFIEGMPQ